MCDLDVDEEVGDCVFYLLVQTLGDYIASIMTDTTEELDSRMSVVESILMGSTDRVWNRRSV